jgi:uncharacterized protein DUF5753/helix-turn-helix protein
MDDREPTARAREIGLMLETAAREADLTGAELARWLGWSQSKVSRIFNGTRPASESDVAAVAAVCRVVGDDRAHMFRLVKDIGERSWLQEYGDRLPIELRTLVGYEEVAAQLTNFEVDFIPGLLQTPAYCRALMRSSPCIPPEEVADRIAARMQRQTIFSRPNRPMCHFFLDEFALLRTGPGRAAMSEQLHHLLQMSVRPYIEIRVIPDTVGFHAGKRAFKLMEFPELKPVVHLEDETGVQFLQQQATVASYRRIVEGLAAVALDEGQSRTWIANVASTLGEPREEMDDLAEEHLQPPERLR